MVLTFKLIWSWDEIEKFCAMVGFMHLMQSRLVSKASRCIKEDGYESGSGRIVVLLSPRPWQRA